MNDTERLREIIRERFLEMWGIDLRSEVERAMLEQETDWVMALLDEARLEEVKQIPDYKLMDGDMVMTYKNQRIATLTQKQEN